MSYQCGETTSTKKVLRHSPGVFHLCLYLPCNSLLHLSRYLVWREMFTVFNESGDFLISGGSQPKSHVNNRIDLAGTVRIRCFSSLHWIWPFILVTPDEPWTVADLDQYWDHYRNFSRGREEHTWNKTTCKCLSNHHTIWLVLSENKRSVKKRCTKSGARNWSQ